VALVQTKYPDGLLDGVEVGLVGLRLMGLPEGVAVGLDGLLVRAGLVEEGLLVGTRVGLVGLPVDGRLEGGLEALEIFLTVLPYEYRGIIECKHFDKYSIC
jgi:hypothetical protein